MKITFYVDHPGETAAGLNSYSETVHIILESGAAGGEPEEFKNHMKDCLADWYDGATVEVD